MPKPLYLIRRSTVRHWGYEIVGKNLHLVAPTKEVAIYYLKTRFGSHVNYRIKEDEPCPRHAKK